MKIKYIISILVLIVISIFLIDIKSVYASKIPLTITNNPSAANGKGGFTLDWSGYQNQENKVYKIYQKKPSDTTFQSISTVDLENQNETVKVLNVYPNIEISNSLKTWMETNGYGMNKIKVTPVPMSSFNQNPYGYLKDVNNNYIYDVIMFGSYDVNGHADLNETSAKAVREFINAGRGVLFGHDTILEGYNNYFFSLKDLVNIETGLSTPYLTKIKIKKQGLLTNYPHDLMNENGFLDVPASHVTAQYANGDIWMEYNDAPSGRENYYLTTWNNAAMIQTGHSIGQATHDEQRLIANTLFYLKQITNAETRIDNSAQDLASPNTPTFNSSILLNSQNNQVRFMWNIPLDNGSKYSYYVNSYNSNDIQNIIDSSDIITENSITGIKGYYYLVDNNPKTNFKINDVNVKYTTNNFADINNYNGQYIHVIATDGAGNLSNILHISPRVFLDGSILFEEKNNYKIKRPKTINIQLYRNNTLYKQNIINIDKNNSTYNFNFYDLEKYDNNGNIYNYSFKQIFSNNQEYYDTTNINPNTFKNTLIKMPKITINIKKGIFSGTNDISNNLSSIGKKDKLYFNLNIIDITDNKMINNQVLINNKNNTKIDFLEVGHTYKISEKNNQNNLFFYLLKLKEDYNNLITISKDSSSNQNDYILSVTTNIEDDIIFDLISISNTENISFLDDFNSKENLIKLQ